MLKNYFIFTLRNIRKQKGYSLINVVGLAIGMACCILILLWVQDEFGYDRFHQNGDQIYRVIGELHTGHHTSNYAVTPNALSPTLKENFPEIANSTRFQSFIDWLVIYGDKYFLDDRVATADASFFEIFTFPFVKGNPQTVLNDRYSIVVTERMAKKYFGEEEPMDKILRIGSYDFHVTGVLKDIPHNSHIQFDCLFPIKNMETFWRANLQSWEEMRFLTYVQLEEGSSAEGLGQKIKDLAKGYMPVSDIKVYLQPLKKIHLYSDIRGDEDNVGKGSITFVYIFSLIGLCILVIACINFMNLATARSANRTREIGIKKVVGASRRDLIGQFMSESLVFSLIALLLAIVLARLFLPVFNQLAAKQLTLGFAGNPGFILGLIVITLLTGLLAGSYPALFLSSLRPANVLRGIGPRGSRRGVFFRKLLVVGQFTFAVFLIVATLVIYLQLEYIRSRDLGFKPDNVLFFSGYGKFDTNFEAVKGELRQNPNILNVSKSIPPVKVYRTGDVDWEGKNPEKKMLMMLASVDYDYLETFRMKMAAGRFYSRAFATDVDNYVINETAAKEMGLRSPLGKWFAHNGKRGTIIGVVRDFHQGSLHQDIEPLFLKYSETTSEICIRIKPENIEETLSFLDTKWKQFVSYERPFIYEFVDETIASFYKTEQKIGAIVRYFTILAILISCLGLLGLASYMTEQRTKEIGIRKVMGASIANITRLFSSIFSRWVGLASIIAWPMAWYAMNLLLKNYAYHIGLYWWIFLLAGGIALAVALLTVSYQTVRAARTNPVNSLRYE